MIDARVYGAIPDGTTNNSAAINAGLLINDVLIQNGIYLIESAIVIPSNRTLYIKNAKIILKSGSYDNMFRNSDFDNGNENISIVGLGNALIDGNSAGHNDGYSTWGKGTVNTYKYFTGCFCNVTNLNIYGVVVSDYAHWCWLLQGVTTGTMHDIYFNYKNVIANQDGIDINWGCNNLEIYNLSGRTVDDTLCLAVGKPDFWVVTEDTPVNKRGIGDIYNIDIHDLFINSTAYHPIVFLGGDGNKIHDIIMDDWTVFACTFLLYFGLTGYYDVAPTKDEVFNITANNITINAASTSNQVIQIKENCKDITFTNITNNTGKTLVGVTAMDIDNVVINGTDYSN